MSVFEMAKKYYPRLWPIERIDALLEAGKLTAKEYESLITPSDEQGDVE